MTINYVMNDKRVIFIWIHLKNCSSSLNDFSHVFFQHRNILLRPLGNTIYVLPPYCITDAEFATIYAAIAEAAVALS